MPFCGKVSRSRGILSWTRPGRGGGILVTSWWWCEMRPMHQPVARARFVLFPTIPGFVQERMSRDRETFPQKRLSSHRNWEVTPSRSGRRAFRVPWIWKKITMADCRRNPRSFNLETWTPRFTDGGTCPRLPGKAPIGGRYWYPDSQCGFHYIRIAGDHVLAQNFMGIPGRY